MQAPAYLLLEDGRRFDGEPYGAPSHRLGEVVFNTSMMGYQEILTDPSYAEQIVVMTTVHVGNYGVTPADDESRRPFLHGFVAHEFSRIVSNQRAVGNLGQYLQDHELPALEGIDTRALTRHIRSHGAMRAILVTDGLPVDEAQNLLASYPGLVGLNLAKRVSIGETQSWEIEGEKAHHVVVMDFGVKRNILRQVAAGPARVTVVPAWTRAEEILAHEPDGLLLSNGPGDPEPVAEMAGATVKRLMKRMPVMGICMGHQVLALTLGARTFKMKFGHRGGNQPVRAVERDGSIEITSQNHGFSVAREGLPDHLGITHINLNDDTIEGLRLRGEPVFSVQYHPEAAPGPHDARYLFDEFFAEIRRHSSR
jgi:carbamoyl-phosphate synthase small subunit